MAPYSQKNTIDDDIHFWQNKFYVSQEDIQKKFEFFAWYEELVA